VPTPTSKLAIQVGQRIVELRKALRYTQEELAERADISVSFLSMIERARRMPRVKTLAVLADAFGIPLSQLLVGVSESRTGSREPVVPLMAYVESLRLDSSDVEALLIIAKTMFPVPPLRQTT
jgi:transcriptional regulator with XRE-family HTH domain